MDSSDQNLLRALRSLAHALDEEKRLEWNRSLPLPDLIGDRWERATRLGFGEGASIYDSSLVLGDVVAGPDSWIGPFTILDGSGGTLSIGAWSTISAGTHVYTHDTVMRSLTGGSAPHRIGAVRIADRVYIGPNCIIAAGVSIGTMSVVAANSLVRSDVPPRTVVAGSPAKEIGVVSGDGNDIQIRMHHRDS